MNITDLEILMADRCTKNEAERFIRENRAIIFKKSELCSDPDYYIDQWGLDEEEAKEFAHMLSTNEPMTDWGSVEIDGEIYFINYIL